VYPKQVQAPQQEQQLFWEENLKHKPHIGAVAVLVDNAVEAMEECAIPDYGTDKNFELPNCTKTTFPGVINQYKRLFCKIPGKTARAYHCIPTRGQLIHVLPRRVPAHYQGEVEHQINEILEQGIIIQSSSPGWLQQYLCQRNQGIYIFAFIIENLINTQTTKDAYPLPLLDKVQDHLAN